MNNKIQIFSNVHEKSHHKLAETAISLFERPHFIVISIYFDYYEQSFVRRGKFAYRQTLQNSFHSVTAHTPVPPPKWKNEKSVQIRCQLRAFVFLS